MKLLIKSATLGTKICDMLIDDGTITLIAAKIETLADQVFNADGLHILPGLFDMHVHFRHPGYEYKEDIFSGSDSGVAGGFTAVACMPNTSPVVDTPEMAHYILSKAVYGAKGFVYPIAAITKGLKGEELCDFVALKAAGAIAVSDDGRPVVNDELMRSALKEAEKAGLFVIAHCEDLELAEGGIMHEGYISKEMKVKGIPREAEDNCTARDVQLARETGAKIHIAHVSTKGSIDIIRKAKADGVRVTCETCPHYFMLTDRKLLGRDADYRMNPPLREISDMQAVFTGVLDGTVDCIATDHAPHAPHEKADFETAPNGVIGLETSLAATLTAFYHAGLLSMARIGELMSVNPRKILGLPEIQIREGKPAQLTLVNPDIEWVVDTSKFLSKSRNSAFKGMKLKGKAAAVLTNGKLYIN
jgi:dihydroorotase